MKIKRLIASLLLLFTIFSCNSILYDSKTTERIIIYGDSRTGNDEHRDIVTAILKTYPDIVFHTGDLVNDGNNPEDWAVFNDITLEMRKAALFYPVAGNHEHESDLYYKNFLLPNNEKWYSVTFDDILFIVLNSNLNLNIDSGQYMWLKDILENIDAKKVKFTVVLFHHPPFSTGAHGDERPDLIDSIVPLFEANGVDIVFNGHDHDYERSLYKGIYFIVTGGGGAPLRDQISESAYSQKFISAYHFCGVTRLGDKLNVSVYDTNLNIIDNFTLH